jgi:hypothetical protein
MDFNRIRKNPSSILQMPKCIGHDMLQFYDSQYKPALYNRLGFVNIPELIEKTDQDIVIATKWVPGTIKGYIKGKIIFP